MEKILKLGISGLIIIILAVALHFVGWLKPVENFAVRGLSPVQRGFYGVSLGLKSFYNSWLTKKNLLAENRRLADDLTKYQLDQARLRGLEEENALLKKELNFADEKKIKYLSAQIITGVSDPASRSVIINRGAKDGVARGLAVVADDGVLVGKIYQVYDNFSKVLLLSDNKSRVAATIQNSDRTIGLVEGQFGLSFAMTNIPQDQEIKEGDLVVTSGLEGQIPKNLLIARVDSVNQIESEIFKIANLKPIIPLDDLSYVLVITP